MRCRLIICEDYDPFFNMAFDYYFWKNCERPESFPVLRFYKWCPSSVSIGYNQMEEKIVNLDFCKKSNIPIVMRPTGGSAIFHDIEITYSFCADLKTHFYFSSPFLSYISVCNGIIKGIEKIGIKLEIRGISECKEPSFTNIPCFSLSSRHDIIYNGRKIVGSAQRRNNYSFLQHGSILIDIREDLWKNIFLKGVDFSKIICLKKIVGDTKEEELRDFLKKGFEEVFEFEIFEDELESKEIKEIEKIQEKLKKEGKYE
ncbi:MAG: lipoate--protein ligase family protein [bacterium]|nr:lipoate--protein ligase family protein [bacterium]MDW8164543.1 biotin/lipoate A/B protein ligase family protein [Candidatus Omnitrophota bacterium]